jgi:BolA protein
MGDVADRMQEKLTQAFAPIKLNIVDDSDKHKGHAGAREGGQSHFTVIIESAAFTGVSRVERQRMINHVLADDLAGPVHALSIQASAPA